METYLGQGSAVDTGKCPPVSTWLVSGILKVAYLFLNKFSRCIRCRLRGALVIILYQHSRGNDWIQKLQRFSFVALYNDTLDGSHKKLEYRDRQHFQSTSVYFS